MNNNLKEAMFDSVVKDANQLGELLRGFAFPSQYTTGNLGCYSNFDTDTDLKQVELDVLCQQYPKLYNCIVKYGWFQEDGIFTIIPQCFINEKLQVAMMYAWSGDGFLAFSLDQQMIVYNTDCKKDYMWNFYS